MAQIQFQMPDGSTYSADVSDNIMSQSPEQQAATAEEVHQAAIQGQSWGSTLRHAAHQAVTNVGNTLSAVGLDSAGSAVRSVAPGDAQNFSSASPTGDLSQGNYLRAAGDVAKRVVGGGIAYAPAIAGGAIGGALTEGPVGGLIGGGIGAAASSLGENAAEDAAAKGKKNVDTSDLTPSVLGKTAIDTATGAAMGGAPGGPALRALTRAGLSAGNYAADTAVDGGSPTLKGAADAALTGGAGSLAYDAKALPGEIGARAVTNAPGSAEWAQAQADVGNDVMAAQSARKGGQGAEGNLNAILNGLKTQYGQRIEQHADDLLAGNVIDKDTHDQIISSLADARRKNSTLLEGNVGGAPTIFSDIVSKSQSIPALQPIAQGLRMYDTASTGSFQNQNMGPFRAMGDKAGHALGLGLPIVGNVGGHIGGAIGGLVDRAAGLNVPRQLLQAARARAFLGNGYQPGSTLADLQRPVAPQYAPGSSEDAAQRFAQAQGAGLQNNPQEELATVGIPMKWTGKLQGPPDADEETGLPSDSDAPVNTPTFAPGPAKQPGGRTREPLGPLQIASSADVQQQLQADGMAAPGRSDANPGPQATFIANGLPGHTPQSVVAALRQLEAQGHTSVPPGTADAVVNSPAGINAKVGRKLQDAIADLSTTTDSSKGTQDGANPNYALNKGVPQAVFNATQYHQNGRALMNARPQDATTISTILQKSSKAVKAQLLKSYNASNPKNPLPDWLAEIGK